VGRCSWRNLDTSVVITCYYLCDMPGVFRDGSTWHARTRFILAVE